MEESKQTNPELSDIALVRAQSAPSKHKHTIQPDDYVKNIENGTEVRFYFQKLLFYDGLLTLMTALNIAFTLLYVIGGSCSTIVTTNSTCELLGLPCTSWLGCSASRVLTYLPT